MLKDEIDNYAESSSTDDDEVLNKERERRYAELKARQHQSPTSASYGRLEELSSEQDLLTATLNTPRLVVHFYLPHFRRCQDMSENLVEFAKRNEGVRVVQVEATRAPFLGAKWAIRILPCVVRVENKEAVDKIVGFEGVSDSSDVLDFQLLEERLLSP